MIGHRTRFRENGDANDANYAKFAGQIMRLELPIMR